MFLPFLFLSVSANVFDLDAENFERLVFRPSTKAALVRFSTPSCKKCKQLQPGWHQVEKVYDAHASMLIGNVDCSEVTPGTGNPLCKRYNLRALPTIMFFESTDPKGTIYGGSTRPEHLLSFTETLASACSIDVQDECSTKQRRLLQKCVKVHDPTHQWAYQTVFTFESRPVQIK